MKGSWVLAGSLLLIWLASCSGEGIVATNAWIRAAPDGTALGAAYLEVRNDGEAVVLERVSSDKHASVSIHETVLQNGISRMRALESLPVPARQTVQLAPGGVHLMLAQTQSVLREGDAATLTLHFSNGEKLSVVARVRGEAP